MTVTAGPEHDPIAKRYAAFKRSHKPEPEEHTVRALLGNLDGAQVLDLGCGFGHYARLASDLGAITVVGVDISEPMITLARRMETEEPRGIDYHVHNVARLPRLGAFDVAIAVWLLNYATGPTNLTAMFAAIRANLAPGGRLVAVTVGPRYSPWGSSWEPYGLRVIEASADGRRTHLVMDLLTKPTARLRLSQWDGELYEECSGEAGFGSLTWHQVSIPVEAIEARGAEYWQAYRDNPFVTALECR
ncbi:class I SAM-dependent methyltransferase [Actinophytocola sp.]|uniref:class I SAM-dependent methyltransferase n=1 Tax=Actinophytocola sp. TaxID=1872138 RepID=UPI002D7E62C1|nr:class I SAM-dependent methyltransferase [Actinophytocola sp.]HET9140491.1 class I SAM-dependent methyltransferase [Actinophytocola sp.]